jgi:hypothetical protein
VVKARVVRHGGRRFRSAALAAHVRYLRREGVTRDGDKANLFDAHGDATDEKAFVDRCWDDRHHFRFIVSPEEATKMLDLKAFTGDLATGCSYAPRTCALKNCADHGLLPWLDHLMVSHRKTAGPVLTAGGVISINHR